MPSLLDQSTLTSVIQYAPIHDNTGNSYPVRKMECTEYLDYKEQSTTKYTSHYIVQQRPTNGKKDT